MDKHDLYRSFCEVDDNTLLETENPPATHRKTFFIKMIAACLTLTLGVLGIYYHFSPVDPNRNVSSWFVITAYAEDGDMEELSLNEGFFNSGGSGEALFGVDVPLFNFKIQPTEREEGKEKYARFDISVSYNGKEVGVGDDHVVVSHLIPVPGSNASYEYEVVGWFEDATNITITVTNSDTGILIEELTVHVQPLEDSQTYQLTVIEVKTYL